MEWLLSFCLTFVIVKLQSHLHAPLIGLMCKYLTYILYYLEVSWMHTTRLQVSLQNFVFECLGAKLHSSLSVCGKTLLSSSYYTNISQQAYSLLHCSIQTVEKLLST